MGVVRHQEVGVWDEAKGIPEEVRGRTFSLVGWGSRAQLLQAQVDAKALSIPQMWLFGGSGKLPPIYQRFMGEGPEPQRIFRHGCPVGVVYHDEYADYCLLTGVLPSDIKASREAQTTEVFESIENVLADAGMTFGNVVRTWFYLDHILDWYDTFNRVRDAFFHSRKVYDGLVPASTGIGSANLSGAAITSCVLAVKPKVQGMVNVKALPSPLQCAALQYGSSFSRAVEIDVPIGRTLLISGTASIEPGGATAHVGDVKRQIQLTMDVVEAIIASRGMKWANATRAVMYLKNADYLADWNVWLGSNGLKNIPVAMMEADVCRDDLLVEFEIDLVVGKLVSCGPPKH